MAGDLKSGLRMLTTDLKRSLLLSHVHTVASAMWSARHLDGSDLDEIRSFKTAGDAVDALVRHILAKQPSCIKGFADALLDIERKDLADKVYPTAAAIIRPEVDGNHAAGIARDGGRQTESSQLQLAGAPQQSASVLRVMQGSVSSNVQQQYVAVQLRSSMRRTHLEVQVRVHNDKQSLLEWQQAWRKEKPGQQDVPEPELVTLSDFSVDQAVAVRLTSIGENGETIYHHGCCESEQRDNSIQTARTWLFRLDEKPSSAARQFFLHLHKTLPALDDRTLSDKILCGEICKALKIFPERQEKCFLSQLGFTPENQPFPVVTSLASNFGRHEKSDEVILASSLTTLVKYYQSVKTHAQSVGRITGPQMQGTGFCVGNDQHKYFMTCRHIITNKTQDVQSGMLPVSFYNLDSGESSFMRGNCVAQDAELDYAILKLEDAGNAPQPIPCCLTDVEEFAHDDRYLTVIGYTGELTIDKAAELQLFSMDGVEQVKNYVASLYIQFDPNINIEQLRRYIEEYDVITHVQKYSVFYNVARHKHGSSGSPVFLFNPDTGVKLVALHRCGYPDFYYRKDTKIIAEKLIPLELTVEAGTRLSAISANLRTKNFKLWQEIFGV